ncbi:hypothetical protein TNCV_4212381 [Trichonephila clavipes]|nr:hypothetical protein TNCV_4212381 [Trichonephila clavipes]
MGGRASRAAHIMSAVIPNVLQASSYGSRGLRGFSEGATGAWMAIPEEVGCTHALLMMWWSSQRLVFRWWLSLVFGKMTSLRSTGPNTSSQHN